MKVLQDSRPHFTPPAKFTAEADEIILESAEDLATFSSKFSRAGEDGNLPVPTESPLMFDIIYMGSRPLKMVLNQDKLILIDPQYIKDEEYLTHPPSSYSSSSLDSILPASVIELFKSESGGGDVAPVHAGPRHVSLPEGDLDRAAVYDQHQDDKDTNELSGNESNLKEDELRGFIDYLNPTPGSIISKDDDALSRMAIEYQGHQGLDEISMPGIQSTLEQESQSNP